MVRVDSRNHRSKHFLGLRDLFTGLELLMTGLPSAAAGGAGKIPAVKVGDKVTLVHKLRKCSITHRITEEVRNIKKAFVLLLAILLTVTWYGGSFAEKKQTEYWSGDQSYVLLEDGSAGITDYTGKASSLAIPDTLDATFRE